MACAAYKNWILDYIDGALCAGDRSKLEIHLSACAACREFCEAQESLDLALRQGISAPALSPGFEQRILSRLDPLPAKASIWYIPRILDLLAYSTLAIAGGFLAEYLLSLPAVQSVSADAATFTLWTAGALSVLYLLWGAVKPEQRV